MSPHRRPIGGRVATVVTMTLLTVSCAGSPGVVVVDGAHANTTSVVAIRDGVITDEALAAMAPDGRPAAGVVNSVVAQVRALTSDQQLVLFQDLSRRFELEAARLSGLQDSLGGEQAAATTIQSVWAKVGAQIDAIDLSAPLQPGVAPSGFRHAKPTAGDPPATPGAVGVIGVLMGAMALGTMADPMVSKSNDLPPGQYDSGSSGGTSIEGTTAAVTTKMDYNGPQDDVNVHFATSAVVHPCPSAKGAFAIEAKLDLKTSKGTAGQNIKIDLKINGQVDDDAQLAGRDVETHTQWADFGGADAGQGLDFTVGQHGDAPQSLAWNDASGAVTKGFVSMAMLMSTLYSYIVADRLVDAAKKGWQSGRCVRLDVKPSDGPTGLKPGAKVSVLTMPRSKLDGTPTGGSVTATLASGGKSVDPAGLKVHADATFHYVAPDEIGKGGSVAFEARSKRGVAKATLDFGTKANYAYSFTGGLQDFQVVDVKVCDVRGSFQLQMPGVATAVFSGGDSLSGTYTASGIFGAQYAGTYTITLPNGPGGPGTMSAPSDGSTAGNAGSGSLEYTLTPLDSCS